MILDNSLCVWLKQTASQEMSVLFDWSEVYRCVCVCVDDGKNVSMRDWNLCFFDKDYPNLWEMGKGAFEQRSKEKEKEEKKKQSFAIEKHSTALMILIGGR